MATQSLQLVLMDGKDLRQTIPLRPGIKGVQANVKAIPDGKYVLADKDSGAAPQKVTVRRTGKNLEVFLEGDEPNHPSLIIEDFFAQHSELIGMGTDGGYYAYASSNDDGDRAAVWLLQDGETAQLALGGEQIGGLDTTAGFALLPWALGAVGAGVGAAGVGGGGGGGGGGGSSGSSGGAQVSPPPKPDAPTPPTPPVDPVDPVAPTDPVDPIEEQSIRIEDVIREVIDNTGDITGPILNGGVTDDPAPVFGGVGNPGDTIVILDGDEEIGSVEVDEDGNWSFKPDTPLTEGDHEITVIIRDPEGNETYPEGSWDIIVDTTPPTDPVLGDEEQNGLHEIIDDAGALTGPIAMGGVTDDTTPTFKGSGAVGDIVIIRNGDEEIGRVLITEADGTWSFTPATELADGEYAFNVVMQDPAGNRSEPSPDWAVTIDSVVPSTPVFEDLIENIIDDVGPITGPILKGGVTDDATPTLNGTGEPGLIVIIRDNGEAIGSVVVGEDGKWTFTTPELDDGEHTLDIIVQDELGRQSAPSNEWNFQVDATPPGNPVLGEDGHGLHEVIDDVGAVTGPIAMGGITDDSTPTLKGTGEVGDTVIIRNGSEEIGRVVISETDGSWSFTPETELADGEYLFNIVMQDPAGNQSQPSADWIIEINTTAPDDPVLGGDGHGLHEIIDDVGAVTGPIVMDGITDDSTPTLKGTGVMGDTVIIRDGDIEIGRVVIDNEDGLWSFTPEGELADGNYAFNVIMQDPVGKQSKPSANWNVEISTDRPAPQAIEGIVDDFGPVTGAISNGGLTDDNTPTLHGTGDAGNTVIIRDNGKVIGEVVIDEAGKWSFTTSERQDGDHRFDIIIKDEIGRLSVPSPVWDIRIDTTPPSDPTLGDEGHGLHEIIDDHGDVTGPIANNGITDDATPTFNGTGVVGDTVIIRDGNVEIGRVTITQADGSWSFTPEPKLADGNYAFNVVMQNPAGNQSNPSPNWNVEIDTIAPADPVLGDEEQNGLHEIIDDHGDITGPIADNGVTDDATPTFNGTGVTGDTVIIRNGHEEIGRVTITAADGSWSFTPETNLPDGNYTFNVVMQDPAGNQSNPSPSWNVEIDTVAPGAPVILDILDDFGDETGTVLQGSTTDDKSPTLSGTTEIGSRVFIYDNEVLLGEAVVDELGNWTFIADLADGQHSMVAVAQDKAGNPSGASAAWEFVVDSTPAVGPTQTASLLHMGKDGGYSGNDFLTNDGSGGRLLYGELNRPLKEGQFVEVSCDGGLTWGIALLDGNKWAFQDRIDHGFSSWTIQIRVSDQDGNSGPVTSQDVRNDQNTPSNVKSAILIDHFVEISLPDIADPRVRLEVGDRIAIYGDLGTHRYVHILTQDDFDAGKVRVSLDPDIVHKSVNIATVDMAGNISNTFLNVQTVVSPSRVYTVTGEESEIYGSNANDIFQIYDIDALNKVKVIDGGAGPQDQLKLMGSDQVLDLSALQVRLSSIASFDITGTGNNTLKISLGDVLQLSSSNTWVSEESYQVGILGDAGDKVEISRLLPNGMDGGEWNQQGFFTASGITYDVFTNTGLSAEIYVQQGVTVELI